MAARKKLKVEEVKEDKPLKAPRQSKKQPLKEEDVTKVDEKFEMPEAVMDESPILSTEPAAMPDVAPPPTPSPMPPLSMGTDTPAPSTTEPMMSDPDSNVAASTNSLGDASVPPPSEIEKMAQNEKLDFGEENESKLKDEGKRPSLKFILMIAIVSALVAAIVSGGVYVYLNSASTAKSPVEDVEPTSTPVVVVPEATSTPEPQTVDLESFSVSVLNGSGAAGAAGAGQTLMEEAGFSVTDTANAGSYDFKNTVVQVKASVPAVVVESAKNALSSDYTVEVGDPLDDASEYDIVVTIGTTK
ncbi:hypothetical protein A2801_01810 [Candidatus Woesebacteria bacterium RIFCSPHIGHO2_01_FULL_41_10]|uniref:LytR/CpsA/Psr regulator C-terminal domain-containing protein n=1 Tax=Candidatus Woesebacteria bacterium RIFCSPHIGHO2_01_FULL_41_10 TaxID=1802500 RepID=A0A1F7YMN5_9BACT|nr:MAG: hypothetical protein A2801_01810 [Candidatus Woesebacteria bacterium RIFCSPHIGHO2_01_FULL_41_10]